MQAKAPNPLAEPDFNAPAHPSQRRSPANPGATQAALGSATLTEFLPTTGSHALVNGFERARQLALNPPSVVATAPKNPPSTCAQPAPQAAVLQAGGGLGHLSRTDQYEIFRKLVAGWRPEAISIHLERTKGLAASPEAIQEFSDAIPPEVFAPPSYLHGRYGAYVEVDPMLEIHYLLTAMRERFGAALLLEELEGRPNQATDKLAESYFNMLAGTVKLQQSQGDLPNKAAESAPGTPGGLQPLAVIINNGAATDPERPSLANPFRARLASARPDGSQP
jgi:hypothetical protein